MPPGGARRLPDNLNILISCYILNWIEQLTTFILIHLPILLTEWIQPHQGRPDKPGGWPDSPEATWLVAAKPIVPEKSQNRKNRCKTHKNPSKIALDPTKMIRARFRIDFKQ